MSDMCSSEFRMELTKNDSLLPDQGVSSARSSAKPRFASSLIFAPEWVSLRTVFTKAFSLIAAVVTANKRPLNTIQLKFITNYLWTRNENFIRLIRNKMLECCLANYCSLVLIIKVFGRFELSLSAFSRHSRIPTFRRYLLEQG